MIRLSEVLKVSLDELVKGEKVMSADSEIEDDNLKWLEGREYVINPETGKYEKRDGLAILLDFLSEYWWLIFFVPLIISYLKQLVNLF